jgi:hypothetical protein
VDLNATRVRATDLLRFGSTHSRRHGSALYGPLRVTARGGGHDGHLAARCGPAAAALVCATANLYSTGMRFLSSAFDVLGRVHPRRPGSRTLSLFRYTFVSRAWPSWARYLATVLIVCAMLGLRLALGDLFQGYPFLFFFLAILASERRVSEMVSYPTHWYAQYRDHYGRDCAVILHCRWSCKCRRPRSLASRGERSRRSEPEACRIRERKGPLASRSLPSLQE